MGALLRNSDLPGGPPARIPYRPAFLPPAEREAQPEICIRPTGLAERSAAEIEGITSAVQDDILGALEALYPGNPRQLVRVLEVWGLGRDDAPVPVWPMRFGPHTVRSSEELAALIRGTIARSDLDAVIHDVSGRAFRLHVVAAVHREGFR